MTSSCHDFEPDDDFASADDGTDADDELTTEALIWQLLLRINPGDEESALQQFAAWQEQSVGTANDAEALASLREAIDWKAGFHVAANDGAALADCLDQLAARWNLRIDWGRDETGDDALPDVDVPALLKLAHDQLREYGYTLWTWSPRASASEEVCSGWIGLRSDDEALELIARALGIELRPGGSF